MTRFEVTTFCFDQALLSEIDTSEAAPRAPTSPPVVAGGSEVKIKDGVGSSVIVLSESPFGEIESLLSSSVSFSGLVSVWDSRSRLCPAATVTKDAGMTLSASSSAEFAVLALAPLTEEASGPEASPASSPAETKLAGLEPGLVTLVELVLIDPDWERKA